MWLVECDKVGNVDQNLAKSKELEEYILKTLKIIVVLQVSVKKSIYQNLVKNRKKTFFLLFRSKENYPFKGGFTRDSVKGCKIN